MDKVSARKILERLIKYPCTSLGICDNYIHASHVLSRGTTHRLMIECCKELGYYSNNDTYPIACRGKLPDKAFENTPNLWSIFTNYGRRRRRVRKLMIKKLKEILND